MKYSELGVSGEVECSGELSVEHANEESEYHPSGGCPIDLLHDCKCRKTIEKCGGRWTLRGQPEVVAARTETWTNDLVLDERLNQ